MRPPTSLRERVELVESLGGDVAEHLLEGRVGGLGGFGGSSPVGRAGRVGRCGGVGRVGGGRRVLSASVRPVARCPARALQAALDPGPLLRHDLLELAPDVAQDVAEVEPLAQLLAPPAEPIHEVLEAGQVGPRRVTAAPAALHQAAERLGDVALGHDVVGELVEDLVRVEVGDLLGAVPARVAGAPREGRERVIVRRPDRCATRPPRSRGSGE